MHRSLSEFLTKEGLLRSRPKASSIHMCTRRRRRSRRTGDEGRQIEVVQKGYKLGDKVLRPARVVVAAQKIDEA